MVSARGNSEVCFRLAGPEWPALQRFLFVPTCRYFRRQCASISNNGRGQVGGFLSPYQLPHPTSKPRERNFIMAPCSSLVIIKRNGGLGILAARVLSLLMV